MRLGSDPEVFLLNKEGKHLAINGYINAGKLEPLQIPDMPKGFTLQEDNVALEYGIPPAANSKEFVEYIQQVMERSRAWLPPDVDFSRLSCTVFEDDQLKHPLARIFGCEPDYCAYTGSKNPKPRVPVPGMRSAGGHVHIETKEEPFAVVKAADLFLGVPSVLMDEGRERKQLYGKAGACRIKPYGVEYRTLSNFWIFSPVLIDWVWRNTERALDNIKISDKVSKLVRKCINEDDQQLARQLVHDYKLEVILP